MAASAYLYIVLPRSAERLLKERFDTPPESAVWKTPVQCVQKQTSNSNSNLSLSTSSPAASVASALCSATPDKGQVLHQARVFSSRPANQKRIAKQPRNCNKLLLGAIRVVHLANWDMVQQHNRHNSYVPSKDSRTYL
jgi:hypothetical protein